MGDNIRRAPRWLRDRGRPLPDALWVSYRMRGTDVVVTTEARRTPNHDTVWLRSYVVDVPESEWHKFPPAEAHIPILPGRSRVLFVPVRDTATAPGVESGNAET